MTLGQSRPHLFSFEKFLVSFRPLIENSAVDKKGVEVGGANRGVGGDGLVGWGGLKIRGRRQNSGFQHAPFWCHFTFLSKKLLSGLNRGKQGGFFENER